jgi:protein-L-isoaspartate O-methyltransferase
MPAVEPEASSRRHSDASVPIQREGDALDALARGPVTSGHTVRFAQRHLDRLGIGAVVVEGDTLDGYAARAPYDRIHSGIGVPCVPPARVDRLAPGGRLLTTLATRTPSRPGQLLVTRAPAGRVWSLPPHSPDGHQDEVRRPTRTADSYSQVVCAAGAA